MRHATDLSCGSIAARLFGAGIATYSGMGPALRVGNALVAAVADVVVVNCTDDLYLW